MLGRIDTPEYDTPVNISETRDAPPDTSRDAPEPDAPYENKYSELSLCGLTHRALTFLKQFYPFEEIFASFLFLRCGGSYDIVSELISLKFGTGWSERSCSDKIPAFFKKLHSDMKDTWLCLDSDILHHESNAVLPFWDKDIKVVMSTVPLYVDSLPHCYQPKYATHVVKALVASTMSGYVCFTADTLYCGASSDAVIQDCSGILDFLAHNRVRALADGRFYDGLTDRLIVPHSKAKIWCSKRPKSKSMQKLHDSEAEGKMCFNEKLAHFRSRVEHIFSRSCCGKWLAFKQWTHSPDFLYYAFSCALMVHNMEVFHKHGPQGRYPPLTPEKVEAVKKKIIEHKGQSSRYGVSDSSTITGPMDKYMYPKNLDAYVFFS